ncbi:hypothetical protein MPSI1_000910 [Malassezia psittaci]|uniref:Uncharacterized protein n=1 Tax=Malassezia psittaci TaxID=1821823 RepID=A0AAF0JDC9_9BASI|nr:hypothetical protein MPSI1_000910 [Malassezia psittaci]
MLALRRLLGTRNVFQYRRAYTASRRLILDTPAEIDTEPTLESIDALQPTALNDMLRMQPQNARAEWESVLKQMLRSFTRPQLYKLAKEAELSNVKHSTSKNELARAFMVQRFSMQDGSNHPSIPENFFPLEPSVLFLLAYSKSGFPSAVRSTNTEVSIEKQAGQIGAAVRGSKSAIAQMKEWLETFLARIHRSEMTVPDQISDRYLQYIARASGCYIERDSETAKLFFLDATAAFNAYILVQQAAFPKQHDYLLLHGVSDQKLPFLAFEAGTKTCVQDAFAMEKQHVRYTLPADTTQAFDLDESKWNAMRQTSQSAPIASWLRDGDWRQQLVMTFGHALYPASDAKEDHVKQLESPLFLQSEPPSCRDVNSTMGPYVPSKPSKASHSRLFYYCVFNNRPLELIISLERSLDKTQFQYAEWVTSTDITILCPTAPVDASLSLQYRAPASIQALRKTALDTYLQSIHAWGDEAYPGADIISPDAHPSHPALPPKEIGFDLDDQRLCLKLRRTEKIDSQEIEYHLDDDQRCFVLHQNATKTDAMRGYAHTSTITWSYWPTIEEHTELLNELVQTPYEALGRRSP